MDGPSVEHSDSDSGESWTLLENNSVYADEAPEFIEEQAKHDAQHHHEKDEDTDGISIISDSDHETPSPQPTEHTIFEKCHLEENTEVKNFIPEYIPPAPHLPDIDSNTQDQIASEDFLGDTHAKHKTYVHRRNKRLSTVLNIIVLGSVITAAGVAIGHMWGAKNDCTIQTTSSVNKILSNLYKLQEENAYLRSKLKEFTFINNNQVQQHKIQSRHNKCRRVFEESLSNNDPRKVAKCVDESYKNVDNLMEHLVKPKYEKEFVADIDKLKTVYLQNKSWLDDEISRRMKIEEELLKKYNNEVKSGKEQNKPPVVQKNEATSINLLDKNVKEETLDNFVKLEIPTTDIKQKKVTYADSLQTEHSCKLKGDDKKYVKDESNDWLNSKHNINNFDHLKQDIISNIETNQNQIPKSGHDDDRFINDFMESAQEDKNYDKEKYGVGESWTEVKPKFRRNEERYESDYDKSISEPKQKTINKIQQKSTNEYTKEKPKFPKDEHYLVQENSWSNHAQEEKNKGKKEKRYNKQSTRSWKNDSNENRVLESFASEEDIVKDDRYVVNKLKQAKKKNGYVNSNKKQKRKIKHDKWNTKGEFGERYEAVETPEDFVLNSKNHINFDIVNNAEDTDRVSSSYKDNRDYSEKLKDNAENNDKKTDNKEQDNWFEKRAVFRTEARKKYYEQFSETSPNNSSWYFRRMRKREQCRAKGDNSTFRKIYKDKKNYKVKY